MKNNRLGFAALAIATLVSSAGAGTSGPRIVSMGSGTPLVVTDVQPDGKIYIGGSSYATTAPFRMTLDHTVLSVIEAPLANTGSSGWMSKDGLYLTTSVVNNPRFAIGNATTATVTPAFNAPSYANPASMAPSPTLPSATEISGARWDIGANTHTAMSMPGIIGYTPNPNNGALAGNSGVYGPSSNSGTEIVSSSCISPNGRFIGGYAQVSTYNAAGSSITANSFYWRPTVWDANTGVLTVLPTPFKTSAAPASNRRRTGRVSQVSNDGLVICGATEHNIGATAAADPDGARLVVWRWNAGTSSYDMTYLDTGVDGNGFPNQSTITTSSMRMNAAGTIIACRVSAASGNFIGKWTWNGASWVPQVVCSANVLAVDATWLPLAVTSAPVNIPTPRPNMGGILAMSDDGMVICGDAVYSTGGSFMSGGFIWTDPSVVGGTGGVALDWYDYLNPKLADISANYGPIGDNGDPTRGLPRLGNPVSISPDGTIIGGRQGGTQIIVGAVPYVFQFNTADGCVPPSINSQPAATVNFTRCGFSGPILNISAKGTLPLTYQWYKDGNPINPGPSGVGVSVYDFAGTPGSQFRITGTLSAADAGTYHCVVSGPCGTPVQSTSTVVQVDPSVPVLANDTCATALPVGETTTTTYNPCGAFTDDMSVAPSCLVSGTTILDAWYKYTPTFTGNARIESCGSTFDTLMTAYEVDLGGCAGNELACSDNFDTGPATAPTCSANSSRIARLPVTSGVPILIRIAGKSAPFSTTQTGALRIFQAPPIAAGNDCSSPITAVCGANAMDTNEATSDGSVASCLPLITNAREIWYTFTPLTNGLLKTATCGGVPAATWNTIISVQTDCGGGVLDCNDTSVAGDCAAGTTSQGLVKNVAVVANTPYLVRVAGNSASAFGTGTMTLTFASNKCQPADVAFDDGTPITANANLINSGVNEGDYNAFFQGFFDAIGYCNIADDAGFPLPSAGGNTGVNEGDYNCFFQFFFNGCP